MESKEGRGLRAEERRRKIKEISLRKKMRSEGGVKLN